MHKHHWHFLVGIIVFLVIPCGLYGKSGPKDNVVLEWNTAALTAIRGSRLGPPVTARSLAILHACIFDAWAAYDVKAIGTEYHSKIQLVDRSSENKWKSISFAAYTALTDLYPSGTAAIFEPLMMRLGYDANGDLDSPAEVGIAACRAVLRARYHDGANQLGDLVPGHAPYSDWTGWQAENPPSQLRHVTTPASPNRWQPLVYPDSSGVVLPQVFLDAHWYKVRPFALTSGDQFRRFVEQFGPPQEGSREYALESCELVGISAHLSDRQKAISEYWADGPRSESPPGHWNRFAQYVSRRDNHSLDDDVKLFFALNNALLDVSIAAWDVKRTSESVRPITAIPLLFKDQKIHAWGGPGQGTVEMDGASWMPYQPNTFPTPPFPEYVSGHSAFSAAGATILRLWTGKDTFGYSTVIRRGSSKVEPNRKPSHNVLLRWKTFTDAADEAGMSRRYGGIHFLAGDLAGRELGKLVGTQAWDRSLRFWTDKPTAADEDFLVSQRSEELNRKLSTSYRTIALHGCTGKDNNISISPMSDLYSK